jgi:cyclophilin family peptidyl-prolyl cis-trans isomerase
VLRIIALLFAFSALAPLSPLGCPPTEPPPVVEYPEREALTVTASAEASVAVGAAVTLQSTVVETVSGLQYSWAQIGGPGVPIVDASLSTASFTAPSLAATKNLTFLVTATTDEAMGQAEVTVEVLADPNYGQSTDGSGRPKANAGADQRVLPGVEVVLSGASSTGTGLSYHWRQVSGTEVTLTGADAVEARFAAPPFDAEGTNNVLFELAVTDSSDRTVTDRVQVVILDPTLSETQVKFVTSKGDIILELDPEKAPLTVANFLQYVDDGFYDGTIFHRVIPDFVIQGGGFEPGLVQKTTRDPIVNEADNGLSNVRGSISMARTSDPDSATSQFFINVKNNIAGGDGLSDLDPGGVSPDGYAVFGRVLEGMDVADEIVAVETTTTSGYENVPVEDILIESASRLKKSDER